MNLQLRKATRTRTTSSSLPQSPNLYSYLKTNLGSINRTNKKPKNLDSRTLDKLKKQHKLIRATINRIDNCKPSQVVMRYKWVDNRLGRPANDKPKDNIQWLQYTLKATSFLKKDVTKTTVQNKPSLNL